MNLGAAFSTFAAVFPAELPDKTMVATIVLVTRFRRPVAVWVGAAAAFAAHVVVAVAAGGLLSLLPDTVVTIITAALFSAGAVVLVAQRPAARPTSISTAPSPGTAPRRSARPRSGASAS